MLNNCIGNICRTEKGMTVVMVTSQIDSGSEVADRIGIRGKGKVFQHAPAGEVFRNQKHARLNQFLHTWSGSARSESQVSMYQPERN